MRSFPNLILGRGPCPRPTLEGVMQVAGHRFEGWFHVQRVRNGKVIEEHKFRNVLTNTFLDRFGSTALAVLAPTHSTGGVYLMSALKAGTGASPAPAATDSNLQAPVADWADQTPPTYSEGYVTGPPDYVWRKVWREYSEDQANGNLAELGFFSATSSGVLMNRVLFRDSGGTPITISKTSSDRLRIGYELRCYPPTADVTGTLTLDSVDYDYTIRAMEVDDVGTSSGYWLAVLGGTRWSTSTSNSFKFGASQSLGTRTGSYTYDNAPPSSLSYATYVDGNKYRDLTVTANPSEANISGGIGGFAMSIGSANNMHMWQCVFDTKIPKDNTKRLILNLRWSWDSYTIP